MEKLMTLKWLILYYIYLGLDQEIYLWLLYVTNFYGNNCLGDKLGCQQVSKYVDMLLYSLV